MKNYRGWIIAGVAILASTALLMLAGPLSRNEASSLSTGGEGLLLARHFFESRQKDCSLFQSSAELPADACLVLAFPASGGLDEQALLEIRNRLRRGGRLLLLYSSTGLSVSETRLLEGLGIGTRKLEAPPSLNFSLWWREQKTPRKLVSPGLEKRILISRPALVLDAGADDEILLEDPENHDVYGLIRHLGGGTLFLLPSEVPANQRLLREGNLDFLDRLLRRLPETLVFDEQLHGLPGAKEASAGGTPMADVLLAHFFLIYILALLALGRRMGPAWSRPARAAHSVSGLLLRSGAVHRRMGHHREAAAAMLHRATEYHGWSTAPPELVAEARNLRGPALVDFARKVALLQKGTGKQQ